MAPSTVSVVIPTYYRNDLLREALDSVYTQSYTPLEVVVVDDSGEAYAKPVADDYDLTYIALEENQGAHAARNVGVDRSTGEYVQFLDDDDRLLPGKLEKQVSVLENNEDVGVVYCGHIWQDGPTVRPKPDVRGDVLEAALEFSTVPCMMGTMLISRDVIDRITPFRHRHGADDIGMKVELARETKFEFVDEVLVQRRNTEGSLGTTQAAVDGRWEVIRTYDDLYEQFPPEIRRAAVAETHLAQGQVHVKNRRWSPEAIAAFARACRCVPGCPLAYAGSLVAACFGRSIYKNLQRSYSRYVVGYERYGKKT